MIADREPHCQTSIRAGSFRGSLLYGAALLGLAAGALRGADSASDSLDCLACIPEGGTRKAVAAVVLIVVLIPLFASATRKSTARDQAEMRKLFAFIRANTDPASVLLANQDAVVYLNTGRKAIRGFVPDGFDLYYAARQSAITPDRLSNAIRQAQVSYVVLTPDAGFPESAAFHAERGGAGARRCGGACRRAGRVARLPVAQSYPLIC